MKINEWSPRLSSLLLLVIFFKLSTAVAQEESIIDQLISLPFPPIEATLLYEIADGELKAFPAEIVTYNEDQPGQAGLHNFLVGAHVPFSIGQESKAESRHFTFILRGENNLFSTIPVSSVLDGYSLDNKKTLSELRKEVADLKGRVGIKFAEINAIEEKLKVLRGDASQVAGIDEIVDLKMELERNKIRSQKFEADQERLRKVINVAHKLTDPLDVDTRRQELMLSLQEAAQVTAMADRLRSRHQEAAHNTLQQKLNLIKETESLDPDALAKEALRLRGMRRELEQKLNIAPEGESRDF